MARRESDREDLLREATALVERAELTIEGFDEPIVVGFRRDGSASFFFGADPVYQFNTAFELRRAFVVGLLYKAEECFGVWRHRLRRTGEAAVQVHLHIAFSGNCRDGLLDQCIGFGFKLRRCRAQVDAKHGQVGDDIGRRTAVDLGRVH